MVSWIDRSRSRWPTSGAFVRDAASWRSSAAATAPANGRPGAGRMSSAVTASSAGSEWTGSSVVAAARRSRRAVARVVGDCRRRRRVPHDAQHSASQGDGRFAARIRPERRGDAPSLRVPAAAAESRLGGQHQREVASEPEAHRSAVHGARRNLVISDLMPDGKARIFTYDMEAKSVVTFPSGGQTLPARGLCELTGVAWSGRGRIRTGRHHARRRTDVAPGRAAGAAPSAGAHAVPHGVALRRPGAVIASRATDDTGYVQPTRAALVAVRGVNSAAPLQRHQTVARARGWDRDECGGLARSCWRRRRTVSAQSPRSDVGRPPTPEEIRERGSAIAPDRHRLASGIGDGGGWPRALRGAVRALSRARWRGRRGSETRRWTGNPRDASTAQDRRQLLAVRHDALGLRESRDAIRQAGPALAARSLRAPWRMCCT